MKIKVPAHNLSPEFLKYILQDLDIKCTDRTNEPWEVEFQGTPENLRLMLQDEWEMGDEEINKLLGQDMTNNELDSLVTKAKQAFWRTLVQEAARTRIVESGDMDPLTAEVFANAAAKAVQAWVELNVPTRKYYVRRTVTMTIEVQAHSAEEALQMGRDLSEPDWYNDSLDTENEYQVENEHGNPVFL